MAEWGFDFARLPLELLELGQPRRLVARARGAAEADRPRRRAGPPVRHPRQHQLPPHPRLLHQRPGDGADGSLLGPQGRAGQGPRRRRLPLEDVRRALQGDPEPAAELRPHQRAALGEAVRGLPRRALRRDRAGARGRHPGGGPGPADHRRRPGPRPDAGDGDRGPGGRPEHARLPAEGGQPPHGHLGAEGRVRELRRPHLAPQGQEGRDLGQGAVAEGADRALAASRGEGGRGPRRGVGLLQQDAPRRGPRVDGGLPVALEGSRLGLGAVEPAGQLRRPRLRARGRGLRGLQGQQARPQDARAAQAATEDRSAANTRRGARPRWRGDSTSGRGAAGIRRNPRTRDRGSWSRIPLHDRDEVRRRLHGLRRPAARHGPAGPAEPSPQARRGDLRPAEGDRPAAAGRARGEGPRAASTRTGWRS